MDAKNHTQAGWLDLTRCTREYPISRRKIQALIYAQRLRAYRLDGKIFIKREDLEKLLLSTPVAADLDRRGSKTAQKILGK
jgi:hypothetical protein